MLPATLQRRCFDHRPPGKRQALRGRKATEAHLQVVAELLAAGHSAAGAAVFLFTTYDAGRGSQGEGGGGLCLIAGAGTLARPGAGVAALARRVAARRPEDDPIPPWSFEDGLVATPMDLGAERLGALVAWPGECGEPEECWLRQVRGAASVVASLVACCRLGTEVERRKTELRSLEEIGGVVERATTTEGVLEGIFEASVRALHCDTASLFAVDERGESLQMIAGRNVPAELVQSRQFRMGEGVAGWVAAQNRPVIVPNVLHDPRYEHPGSGLDAPRSLLVVPLRLRGKVIATLCFARRGANAFSPPDLELAEKTAVYAAQALEHARLSKLQANAESLQLRFETLSAVSHDIRTSLSHVKLAAKLAQHRPSEDQRHLLLAQIIEKVDQISALINASLEASRLGSELTKLRITPVLLRRLVDEVLEELTPKLSPRHRLAVNVPPDLEVRADPIQVRRVLANLVDNAVKYSPDGGAVSVSTRATEEGTLVSVHDEGVGIAPECLERVFEQFYRAPESDSSPGFGLGLYTCRRIVEAHGGSIWVESTPGRGSTFNFVIPGGPVAVETLSTGARSAQPPE